MSVVNVSTNDPSVVVDPNETHSYPQFFIGTEHMDLAKEDDPLLLTPSVLLQTLCLHQFAIAFTPLSHIQGKKQ